MLERADRHERILDMIRAEVENVVDSTILGNVVTEEEELENLFRAIEQWVPIPADVVPENIHAVRRDEMKRKLMELVIEHYEMRAQQIEDQQKALLADNPDLKLFTIRDLERSYT